jgi:hypothetical protein
MIDEKCGKAAIVARSNKPRASSGFGITVIGRCETLPVLYLQEHAPPHPHPDIGLGDWVWSPPITDNSRRVSEPPQEGHRASSASAMDERRSKERSQFSQRYSYSGTC